MDNYQARGYMIVAMKRAGMEYKEVKKVLRELHYAFDIYTEDEAEERGQEILDDYISNQIESDC